MKVGVAIGAGGTLLWLALGAVVRAVGGATQDAKDGCRVVGVLLAWPATAASIPIAAFQRRSAERKRQERITAKVAAGDMDAAWAKEALAWDGPVRISQSKKRRPRR